MNDLSFSGSQESGAAPEFQLKKKDVDDWLNEVDYEYLNTGQYKPSTFALNMMNFIKLVNGDQGEANATPVVHLAMLDKVQSKRQRIANLCHRGLGKTTVFGEYFFLYLGVFNYLDNFGEVEGAIYVSDSMENGVKSLRKNIEHRYYQSEFLQHWIPEVHFTDPFIEFKNKNNKKFGLRLFGAKTGLRGTKIYGKRPVLCVLDDLVSDDDAKSRVQMDAIKDTVGKGVEYALDPTRKKIIFNGTPFNKNDILYEAVESGAWEVNVWPVCEKFPCKKSEFRGSWEDRFSFDYVKDQYEMSLASGKLSNFNQELMLRISSTDERLVQPEEIDRMWYPRAALLNNKGWYNFYITTDFATKADQHNDFSVISVWAYNNNGDWFWVDGMLAKQTMDKNIDELFRLVSEYRPQSVGIETSGQQYAFIQWLQSEMMERNIWFNFASEKGKLGIQPVQSKMTRFNQVLPLIKAGKVYFPKEMKNSIIVGEFIQELELATATGFKSKHDDAIDTISMLMYMKAYKPSELDPLSSGSNEDGHTADDPWGKFTRQDDDNGALSSYIV